MSDYFKKRQGQALGIIPPDSPKKISIGIKPISDKKAAAIKAEKEARGGDDTELQKWYKGRQKFLTGKCARCGATYNKKELSAAIASTAHILAKRPEMFPSVATHPQNFLELPPYCGCHNWFDNLASWDEIKESVLWPEIVEKFVMIEPCIDLEERHRITKELMDAIAGRYPFEPEAAQGALNTRFCGAE